MTASFLDTSVFLRHLTADDPVRSPACLALLQAIERGETSVWTSELVIAEMVFVLSSKRGYNLGRETIRDLLLPLIELPRLKLPHKRLYRRVFDLFASLPIDYVDAYHAALIENREQPELYSYDTHFDRIAGIKRMEP
ncbi:MAG: PIN domain-containing protein [Chloroflexota bacterium]